MPFLITAVKIIFFVLSLGIDTLAVSVGLGISGIGKRNLLKVCISFALFESLMPLIGFFAGFLFSDYLGYIASTIGTIILFAVGLWIIKESFSKETKHFRIDTKKGLILTSLSVSMDELAVGFSMGTLNFPIALTVILLLLQTFLFTYIGITFGNRIGMKFAERAKLLAGIVLCGLAIFFLLEKFIVF
jgi:manganese efflux pump family protein